MQRALGWLHGTSMGLMHAYAAKAQVMARHDARAALQQEERPLSGTHEQCLRSHTCKPLQSLETSLLTGGERTSYPNLLS